MGFDFDSFASALVTLSEAFDEVAKKMGIPRKALTQILFRRATERADEWEADLWKHAYSQKSLGDWIYREAKQGFNSTHEGEMIVLAKSIPIRIRRNLIEVAKSIAAPKGGNPPKLDLLEIWQVRSEVEALRKKGLTKHQAYKKISKRRTRGDYKIGAHTIRRACEPKERERSRQPEDKGLAFLAVERR
jgi:hypothetical protein